MMHLKEFFPAPFQEEKKIGKTFKWQGVSLQSWLGAFPTLGIPPNVAPK
jgi:hypothetical protein